ncbi:hypothetical protein BO117_RS13835 [Escherichia coli]|nr:hypothetical protein [Escherichia coli]
MNIVILYGENISDDDIEVAVDVYGIDEVKRVEEISGANLNEIAKEAGCPSEEILVVTNDDLSSMDHLRRIFTDCQYLHAVQSVNKLRKAYANQFPC